MHIFSSLFFWLAKIIMHITSLWHVLNLYVKIWQSFPILNAICNLDNYMPFRKYLIRCLTKYLIKVKIFHKKREYALNSWRTCVWYNLCKSITQKGPTWDRLLPLPMVPNTWQPSNLWDTMVYEVHEMDSLLWTFQSTNFHTIFFFHLTNISI